MNEEVLLAVVWTHAPWRCEYWIRIESAGGALRLFVAEQLVMVHQVPDIDEMLRVAARWLELRATLMHEREWLSDRWQQVIERRSGQPERRRVARGGRRRPNRS